MVTTIQSEIVAWHIGAGGRNVRLAGHALRLLNEAVELCVAAGATPDEIGYRVGSEITKARSRGEFDESVDFKNVRAELADVQILADVIAHHTGGVDMEDERADKLLVLKDREWEADADGALWRPGRSPR